MKHLILLISFLLFTIFVNAQSITKEWTFYNEKDQSECSFSQNQTVKVKWRSKHWKANSKGKLLDISTDSIKIWESGASLSIAKQDIIRMKGKWKQSFWDGFLTAFFIILGAIIAILSFFAWSVAGTTGSRDRGEIQNWFFAGIFFILVGLAQFSLNSWRERINNPFGKHWQMKETQINPNKMP